MKKILFSVAALLAAAVAGCGGGKIDSESVVDVPAISSVPDDNPCDYQNVDIECVEYIREKAEQGDADAQNNLGFMYSNGKGVAQDKREAFRWYHVAANQGYALAQFNLALMYYDGKGVARDYGEALRWYRAAAEQGDVDSQFNLGVMYGKGEGGVVQDKREALRWYRLAAEQGDAFAQYNLGFMYYNGEGVAKDYGEALHWYPLAAEQGHVGAQFNLGLMYYNGKGIARDYGEALRWYRAAAELGLARAQNNLGAMYNKGEGVARDKREAFRWFRKAAEQGFVIAQNNLGLMYDKGEGVARDKREALRWYRTAAEQGDADAQNNLGLMYDKGEGVAKDKREALRWYRAAAKQGNEFAQYNLGLMYENGTGVVKNEREAYIWFLIAKASGYENAEKSLQKTSWQKYLTSVEIKSVKHEAARRFEEIENRRKIVQNFDISQKDDKEYTFAKQREYKNIATEVFENTWRSVVMIINGTSQGSGVAIRPNLVATNCHVIDGGGYISVYKPENRRINKDVSFHGKVVYRNDAYDFCILEVEWLSAIPATIRKYETLKRGESVYALGTPLGLDLSLSEGVISQLRTIDKDLRVIQTDTAISPGSSGGGLFDVEGYYIGIPTKKRIGDATEGIGFAIPADLSFGFKGLN